MIRIKCLFLSIKIVGMVQGFQDTWACRTTECVVIRVHTSLTTTIIPTIEDALDVNQVHRFATQGVS